MPAGSGRVDQKVITLSVLDRSPTRRGGDAPRALRDTVAFARDIEALGYHRFWVSEHHSVPGVAGSAPTVLAAAVASATERIRVGTGGVMLPNHRPLVVAEQFGVLESLFPGRIDMGLGRSVGFTGGVRQALGHEKDDADRFGDQVRELLGFLAGDQTSYPGVHAIPAEGLRVPAFLLATGAGAKLAAELGLPLVIAPVRGEGPLLEAIEGYRAGFRPSAQASRPYVVVSTAIAVAETAERARRLLIPEAWSTVYSRTHGVFPPLSPVEEILAGPLPDRDRERLDRALDGQIAGTPDEVGDRLADLVAKTGADEILVTTSTFDQAERLDSYRALAEVAGSRSLAAVS
ncbi:LLM class flavin-dependent oxidoreductase [Amycolatopsis sp. WAC 04182]|uniref:LLM class flavin-dependent oxidoreductase n=1 Tax=Amycolatopsis sp. WAC 04182 TaxID=2203198 RepID=UPI000F7B8BBA|nr:LLM class flavin-dependent oxidoreductase [Amycolatopsis sp. WAC 04182]RSN62855.1 LLM class flavin-dependent oxidoreductase [Amycolatopsis sp. WAC 04182]